MFNGPQWSIVSRVRKLFVLAGVILGLLAPSAASATILSVFGTVTCTEPDLGRDRPASAGAATRRNTTVPSWDGTPIDVSVGFPVASGADNNYPGRRHLPRLGRHQDHAVERHRAAVADQRLRGLQHHRPRLGLLVRETLRTREHASSRRRANTATST